MSSKSRAIVWFRNDLRLADNPALHAALEAGAEIVPVLLLDEAAGGASRWWLHHSIAALSHDLEHKGAPLVLRRGDARKIIPELAAEIGAESVHAARSFEPAMRAADRDVDAALKKHGIAFHRHLSMSLFQPGEVATKAGGPYGVFTPFSKALEAKGVSQSEAPSPRKIPGVSGVKSDKLDAWKLLPTRPDWAGGLREAWTPGEAGAKQRLDAFMAGPVAHYKEARDIPGRPGTSMLSPHVHFGEISPRTVWYAAVAAGNGKGAETFRKELL